MNPFVLVNMVFPQMVLETHKVSFRKQCFEVGKNPNGITFGIIYQTWLLLLDLQDLLSLQALS